MEKLGMLARLSGARGAVHVDLGRVERNVARLNSYVGSRDVWAVVKGDGYGLGLLKVARAALAGGARALVVDNAEEALALREDNPKARILCLSFPDVRLLAKLASARIEVSVGTKWHIEAFSRLGAQASIHIHVDTGMGRGGLLPHETKAAAAQVLQSPNLSLAGVWSHLAHAQDLPTSLRQRDLFVHATKGIAGTATRHLVATTGLLLGEEFQFDAVRVGLGIFGLLTKAGRHSLGLQLAIGWRSCLVEIYDRPKGWTVGYGGGTILARRSTLGLVSAGLSDGYPRLLEGCVYVRGRRAPILGPIAMTSMVVDLTGIHDVTVGDDVWLLHECGPDPDELLALSRPAVIPNSFVVSRTARMALEYKEDAGG